MLRPVAYIRSDYNDKFGIPKQCGLVNELEQAVVFEPEFRNLDCLRDIEKFEYIWIIWGFSRSRRDAVTGEAAWSPTVRPPRLGGNRRVGVWASRSPYRPNSLGLSSVRLLRIELDGTVEASFKCLPSETERLYHNGNYYFVYYKDGQAQIADATFTLRDDGILAVEYKSIARGNYALCYVSTAPKESMRIYGNNRYETSTKAADQLLKEQGRKTFKSVIVASGKDYPDALSAAYLAKVKDAPILLTDDNRLLETIFYIYEHCDMGTDVYVIGGEGAVSGRLDKLLTSMTDKPMNVIRLAGKNRYQTNIEVLKAAGVKSEELLIVSGTGYADAISASAVGKPLLLAAASGLTREQTEYLATLSTEKATIIGGTAAVTQKVENQLKGIFRTTERIGGKNRYETSANIAKKFFVKSFTVVLAYGGSFPDGLSGAPLAMRYEAPMVLVADTNYSYAKKYAESADAKKTVTFGGTPLISDKTVNSIVPN